MQSCPLCGSSKGVKHVCEVCRKACCHSCCKRYLALADSAEQQGVLSPPLSCAC